MANNRLVFDGLAELKAELRNLPSELTGEASHIVEGAANGAASDVSAEYAKHRVSGDLVRGVRVTHFDGGQFSAGAIVKSSAPHAWLFDNGSAARHYYTVNGKRHPTGAMWGRTAPTHVFVRTMVKARRLMYEALKAVLVRKGFSVSGDA